jgi:stearoyl-CoA desaturase (delta-9 desaturase)
MLWTRTRTFVLFPLFHVIVLYNIITASNPFAILLTGIISYYLIHNLGYSIGYHKLFSHRSFEPKAFYPFFTTVLSMLALYGGPLSSAFVHRQHHTHVDRAGDPHSPQQGRFHAYMGWTWNYRGRAKDIVTISDLLRDYPWMKYIERLDWIVIFIVYALAFSISITLGTGIMLGAILSLHTGFFINAYNHDLGNADNLANNKTWLAKWICPAFNHRRHHEQTSGYNDSTPEAYDWQVYMIDKFLKK